MRTTYNNAQGNRDRQSNAVLVTPDGNAHKFTGIAIPGVCGVSVLGHDKAGKWSSTTFEIIHHDQTVVVAWRDDWDTGRTFPQVSWEDGFKWLSEKASMLTRHGFEQYIRNNAPKTAALWDERAKAEQEFNCPFKAIQVPPVVVTRHPALVELLRERGIINGDSKVLDHATPGDVKGQHVIGVLPLNLACHADRVTEIPMSLSPEMRGKELDLDTLRKVAGEPVTYRVSVIA